MDVQTLSYDYQETKKFHGGTRKKAGPSGPAFLVALGLEADLSPNLKGSRIAR